MLIERNKNIHINSNRPGLGFYQFDVNGKVAGRKKKLKSARFIILLLLFLMTIYTVTAGTEALVDYFKIPGSASSANLSLASPGPEKQLLAKKDVQSILNQKKFSDIADKEFNLSIKGKNYKIITSIDPFLQEFIKKSLNTKSSRYIGIVASEPATGKILSMVGVDKSDPNNNPCVDNKFPAASIFKIVTAAAAIETCRFNESIMLPYTGNQHTLYKGQINKRTERYAHWITLKDAFAKSVNPVFGKIGAFYLGKTGIEKYGRYFGFNKNMDFEIPMPPSNLSVSEKPFELAEVASGFNRATTITPVHGALIAGAILNGGKLMAPSVIDRIFDENQKTIYTAGEEAIGRAVKPETALIVQKLMAETVKSGTLKRSFRGYQKDRILSRLDIGGKTGSIDNSTHDTRIDWFVGYAREKNGAGELAVSVIVAHEDHIGIKSGQYARMIIKQYFQNYFANKENNYARL